MVEEGTIGDGTRANYQHLADLLFAVRTASSLLKKSRLRLPIFAIS
jgi:hypothetical protein